MTVQADKETVLDGLTAYWDEPSEYHDAALRLAALAEQAETLREAREALRELVRLKDGPRDAGYERDKPAAWARARALVSLEGGEERRCMVCGKPANVSVCDRCCE